MNPVTYVDPSGYSGTPIPGDYDFIGPVTNSELQAYYDSVRAYNGADITKIPFEYRVPMDTMIEMEYKGYRRANGVNSQGWERNDVKYFRQLAKAHPEYFDADNMRAIRQKQSPIVNDQFIEYFPQYADYKGDLLKHHHIGGGGQAAAYPETLHPGFGGVHKFETKR